MPGSMFRKAALERLSSPDKLDQLVTVVGPKGWVALYAIFGLVAVTIFWSIFGSVSVKVQANGILLRTGGVLNVPTLISGRITDIAVDTGSEIQRGDVIARIEQPDLLYEIFLLRQNIQDAVDLTKQRVIQFKAKQKNLLKQLKALDERLASRKELFQKGLVTRQIVIDTAEKIQQINFDLDQIPIDIQKEQDNMETLAKQLLTKQDALQRNSRIISPYSGTVVEVKVNVDGIAEAGQNIIGMELVGRTIRELEGLIFVKASDGKKIKRGMSVSISPSDIKTEEYGSMIGTVIEVSSYPITKQAMLSTLGNETFANQMLEQGALFAVTVHLKTDPNSYNGFAWTSEKGPPSKVLSGSLCQASVTVEKRRPISFVIPFLKKTVGIE